MTAVMACDRLLDRFEDTHIKKKSFKWGVEVVKKTIILLLAAMFLFAGKAYAGAQKPAIPVVETPTNNAIIEIHNVTIAWKDSYSQKPHYLWLVQESDNKMILNKLEINKGIKKYAVPPGLLKPGCKYRYKVGVLASKNTIYYSAVKYFETAEIPNITYPVDNYTFKRTEAVLKWESANPENSCVLRLVDEEGGDIILDNISVVSSGEYKIPPEKLSYGKKYRSVVGYKDSNNRIWWSKVVRFAVREKLNPPLYISDIINNSEFQSSGDIFLGQDGTGVCNLCHISYKNSIVMKPGAVLKIPLNKKYITFSSVIGLDDSVYLKGGSVAFRVTGDGKVLFESKVIKNDPAQYFHSMPERVDIDVTGVGELVMEVEDAGDGVDFDSGVWAETYLLEAKPEKQYPVIGYQQGDSETARLLFSNFPELIKDVHMNNQPVCVMMRRNGVIGRNSIIADHINSTSKQKPVYFGVFLHNKNQQDAYLKIVKKGVSASPTISGRFMVDALKEFNNSRSTEISFKAGEYYFLYKGENLKMNAPGQDANNTVNALVEYESDHILEVTVCVVEDISIFDNPVSIDEIPEVPYDGVARSYRGTAEMNPVTSLDLELDIDETDTDSGPLNVSYPVFDAWGNSWSAQNGSFPGWVTNITSDKIDTAIVSDMFPLKEQYNNTEITLSPTNRHLKDSRYLCNLGNWGILYNEKILIKNNTDKNRIVKYYLGTVNSNSSYYLETMALTPSGEPIKDLDPTGTVYKQELSKLVREIEIPAFTEKELNFEYILPNNSCGGLYHTLIQSAV